MTITLNGTTGVTTTGLTSNGIDDNATSTAITIDASENVGIGTSSPDSYYAKKLVVDCGTDGQNGITIKSSTTGAGMFAFADGTSGSDRYRGYINYNHADDSMTLGTAGGSGTVSVSSTGVISGNGSGLTGVGGSTAFGAVGTYTWGRPANDTDYTEGDVATSLITIGQANNDKNPFRDVNGWYFAVVGTTMSGSWRAMARIGKDAGGNAWTGLWVRIS
jgi:hypothetical protein